MNGSQSRFARPFGTLLAALIVAVAGCSAAMAAPPKATRILIVVGPSSHPPGTHEVAAGGRVVRHCLDQAAHPATIETQLVDRWPDDPTAMKDLATIVFLGDLFPPERMEQPEKVKAELARLMAAGCGIVCVHYATGLRGEQVGPDGDHPLLDWLGGYFASRCPHHQSVARVFTATIRPAAGEHPILRGWKPFRLTDEPYYNNYFGGSTDAIAVTPLATAQLPPEAPQKEVVAWAVQRRDGGRGVGVVMPHFFRNWAVADLRKLIVNGIFWSAKLPIPPAGIETTLPELSSFQPNSVEPRRRTNNE